MNQEITPTDFFFFLMLQKYQIILHLLVWDIHIHTQNPVAIPLLGNLENRSNTGKKILGNVLGVIR